MPIGPPHQKIKTHVRRLYERLAALGTTNLGRAPIVCGENLARTLGYDTSRLPVRKKAWKLFAGCGNPLEMIRIEPCWTVLDLGCGVGIDCHVAALFLQPSGKVIGLDLAVELLKLAKTCESAKANIYCHWLAGDAERLPLQQESVNLAIANGSFNLLPDKEQALAEIHRVLHSVGYLAVADLVRIGELDAATEGSEDAWSWCVAGAPSVSELDNLLKAAGFSWWELSIKSDYGPLAAAHLLARKG